MKTYELALRPHSHEWDPALAFSLPPAVGMFGAVYWFLEQPTMAWISGAVVFGAVYMCAFFLRRPRLGALGLSSAQLILQSEVAEFRVELEALDLTAARRGAATPEEKVVARLVTNPHQVVTLPLRAGGVVVVSPANPGAFLADLGVPGAVPAAH